MRLWRIRAFWLIEQQYHYLNPEFITGGELTRSAEQRSPETRWLYQLAE